MKRFMLTFLVVFGSFLQVYAQNAILHCGKLLDVERGLVLTERTILVQNGIIASIDKGYKTPSGFENYTIVDLRDKTVLPGLMDMHVHIESETNPNRYLEKYTMNDADIALRSVGYARTTLMAGFTTIRDLGGSGVNVSIKKAINSGRIVGPRIYTAAKSLAITGGHADPTNGGKWGLWKIPGPSEGVVDGVDAARKAVRQQVKNGADLIKITATGGVLSVARDGHRPQFTDEEIAAVVQTAKDFGITTAAHAHGDEGMRRAVMAGITSIEHGTMMSEKTMELMKQKGTYYVPTITAGKAVADSAKIPNYYPAVVVPKALEIGPMIQNTFSKAWRKGVKIAFGTDAGVFKHGKNALEFQYMVETGMSEIDAIKSATLGGSGLLGIQDKAGSIAKGKWADIIAVNDDPTENIKTLMDVVFVMKGGVVYKK